MSEEDSSDTSVLLGLATARSREWLDLVPEPIVAVDRAGLIEEANTTARQWLATGARLSRRALVLALGLSDRARLAEAAAHAELESTRVVERLVVTRADGSVATADAYVRALSPSSNGRELVGVVLIGCAAPHADADERSLLMALIDGSDDLIYAVDPDGRFLLVNEALARAFGRPRESVVGLSREALIAPRDAVDHRRADLEVLRTRERIEVTEEVHGQLQGATRTYTSHKFPLLGFRGDLLGVGGISRDVTRQFDLQKLMRMSEAVFRQSSNAIIVTDTETRIQRVNPAFERISGYKEQEVVGLKTNILRSGVQDASFYAEMWRALQLHNHWGGELVNRTADGGTYRVWSSVSSLFDENHALVGYMAVQTDLTELRAAQIEVTRLANFDVLTGLPNRAALIELLEGAVERARRLQLPLTLLFADLDHFKEVNDTLGHQVGDELLKVVAARLQLGVRDRDTVARLGGDEFVVILPGATTEQAEVVAARLQVQLREPVNLASTQGYRPQASFGLASFPRDGDTPELLLRNADTAMYAAKSAGPNQTRAYTTEMGEQNARAFDILNALGPAVDENQLRLYLQPKFRIGDGSVVGAEVLVRWERPGWGLLAPGNFIAVAEKGGILPEIDRWVLDHSLQLLARWHSESRCQPGFRLSVNQAAPDIRNPAWIGGLTGRMAELGVPGSMLEIELTEGMLAAPTPEVLRNLEGLNNLGVWLSIDDFGTGYSSMAYLKTLPISVIKIDHSFVGDMLSNPDDNKLVEVIISLAHKLGHVVVAEGVETDDQRRALDAYGCDFGQGYWLSPPLPIAAFEAKFLR